MAKNTSTTGTDNVSGQKLEIVRRLSDSMNVLEEKWNKAKEEADRKFGTFEDERDVSSNEALNDDVKLIKPNDNVRFGRSDEVYRENSYAQQATEVGNLNSSDEGTFLYD